MPDTKQLTQRQEFTYMYGVTLMWITRGSVTFDCLVIARDVTKGSLGGVLIVLAFALVELGCMVVIASKIRPIKTQTRQLKIEALERDMGMRPYED